MSSSSLIGQTIPNTTFVEVPYTDDMGDSIVACGLPTQHKTHDAFKGKKTVIIAVPGAFTPSCTGNHVPPLVAKAADFKAKGYDVWIIAQNDCMVMSAFGRATGASQAGVRMATDLNLDFSKALASNATIDMSSKGFGVRTARYAVIVDEDLKVKYFEVEKSPGEVDVSGAEKLLAAL